MDSFRCVVLCADDFGLADGVSRGIVELAEAGRLSATGAMANMPGWRRAARDLVPLKKRIGIGLHLNLTTGSSLATMPVLAPSGRLPALKELLVRAISGRLPPAEIRAEIERQLDAFVEAHGAPPDFVDGHQHVHVLPVIRSVLLQVLTERGYAGRIWLRDPSDGTWPILRRPVGRRKALAVKALAKGFAADAQRHGIGTNTGFSGFAPLDLSVPAGKVFASAFMGLGPNPVVMCHPGYVDDELRALDPAIESRLDELKYLRSGAFLDLMEELGVRIVAGPRHLPDEQRAGV